MKQILEQWYKNQNAPTKTLVSKAFRQILKNVHTHETNPQTKR